MATTTSGRGWRGVGARAALAILLGLGTLAAGWVRPEPAAAQRGLVDVPGRGPGDHAVPPAWRGGHAPDAWSHRHHDDWRWRHRRPGWYGRRSGWYGGGPGWYRVPGPAYCPGEWVWTGWHWAWAPGC
jgi:hypothetical protein